MNERALVAELVRAWGAHTVLLYGSRARGDDTPESDVDVAAFADVDAPSRDARLWQGLYLDAFVLPTVEATRAEPEQLKLLGARVLLDARGLAGPLLARLEALDAAGPPALAPDDANTRRVWARKMLARIARDDLEARYRRAWLHYQLLEDHFALERRWYRGPKRAFVELAARDPALHAAFVAALAPGATQRELAALVERVVGPV